MMRRWTTSEAGTRPYVLAPGETDDLTSLGINLVLLRPNRNSVSQRSNRSTRTAACVVLTVPPAPNLPLRFSRGPSRSIPRYGMLYAGGLDGWLRRTWGMACQETARMAFCARHAS